MKYVYVVNGVATQIVPQVFYAGTEDPAPFDLAYGEEFMSHCVGPFADDYPVNVMDTLNATGDGFDPYVPPPPTLQEILTDRTYRLIEACDVSRWLPLQDLADLGEATQTELDLLQALKEYRVALTRIESLPGFPNSFTWPVKPY